MWQRCFRPSDHEKRTYRFVVQGVVSVVDLRGPVWVAYTAGNTAMLATTTTPTITGCTPPRGSHNEEPEDAGFEPWSVVRRQLLEAGWKEAPLEWWHSPGSPAAAPKLIKRSSVSTAERANPLALLKGMGFFPYDAPPHAEPWAQQPAAIRRAWAAMAVRISEGRLQPVATRPLDDSRLAFYYRRYVPLFWRPRHKPLLTTPSDMCLPECQAGFFPRLLVAVYKLEQAKLRPLVTYVTTRLQAFIKALSRRLPWLKVTPEVFVARYVAETIAETVWYTEATTAYAFCEARFWRLVSELYLEDNPLLASLALLDEYEQHPLSKSQQLDAGRTLSAFTRAASRTFSVPVQRCPPDVLSSSPFEAPTTTMLPPFRRVGTYIDVNYVEVMAPDTALQVLRCPARLLPLLPQHHHSLAAVAWTALQSDEFYDAIPWRADDNCPLVLAEAGKHYLMTRFLGVSFTINKIA